MLAADLIKATIPDDKLSVSKLCIEIKESEDTGIWADLQNGEEQMDRNWL